MKQYFAKYLPVEGEIKPLDYILDVKLNTIVKLSAQATTHKVPQINTLKEDYKKVKLFLCSRDVHFGRGIYWAGNPFVEYGSMSRDKDSGKINLHDVDSLIATISPSESDCFQIVGKISPNATWVKEGNEFEEAEVKFVAEGNGDIYYKLTYDEFKRKFVGDALTYFIELKGPCGHFH